MLIEVDKVVTFHYCITEDGKEVLEDSRDSDAMVYLHGHNSMLPGVEEALTGKKTGENLTVTLTPEKAYGEIQENAVQRVSLKHIIKKGKKKIKYKVGMKVQLGTQEGPRDVTIVKVGLKTVDIDTNHPFAGKTLKFDIEVTDVREATEEEVEHKHAHGPGGHNH